MQQHDPEAGRPVRSGRPFTILAVLLVVLLAGGVAIGVARAGDVGDLFAAAPEPSVPSSQLEPISGEERMALPQRSLESFGGAPPVELADYRGQPMLINFWATWCVPCLEEMPILREASEQAAGQVVFLGVNVQDSEDKALELLRDLSVTYDQARDPAAAFFTEVNGFGMPTTLLVDSSGVITYRHTGAVEAEQLRRLLARHLDVDL